ncbi:MAG: macro domain-containing protein [Planctomycetes bacterium]|nr:macro domain-containing protein [Planctomycetota bacterium]
MIEHTEGNILEADAEALVNTVNCVGVMGKGIALQFKQAYPDNFRAYQKACKAGEVKPGRTFVWPTGLMVNPKCVINFPTKRHWKGKSRLEDVEASLDALIEEVKRLGIQSIAVPPLGCGMGGLDWADVGPRIATAFAALPEVRVLLFAPAGAPKVEAMPVATEKANMTRARALFVKLIRKYCVPGYRLSLLEIQKLAYFLQEAGEPLRLRFVKHNYGPYAENLNHVLQRIEGHFIRGYGDRSKGARIQLLPRAAEQAEAFLAGDPDAEKRLERVARLIDGFETPYGMELLATVHWVAKDDAEIARDDEAIIERVQNWSQRKRARFQPDHIRKTAKRFRDEDWLPA